MSVNIGKNGIVTASGVDVGENLARNSSLSNNLTLWGHGGAGTLDFVKKDGYDCMHNTGALSTTAYASAPSTINDTSDNSFTPYNGLTLTLSCDVLFENVVKGTTNYYVALYKSGQTIDGVWRTPSIIGKSDFITSDYLDPTKLNGKGWQRVWMAIQFGDYAWKSGYKFSLYARDYTGDTYWKNFKIELGSVATPWCPNETDDIYVGSTLGFTEAEDTPRIGKAGYIQTTEFIEW